MHLQITKLTSELIIKAKEYFNDDYIFGLKNKYSFKESLVARYLIDKNKLNYSCISHKKNLVFIATSKNKIGIDIENFKKRDISVLDTFSKQNYEVLGGKNGKNFYILWTACESIIKYSNGCLDNIGNYKITFIKKINKSISGIDFYLELNLSLGEKKFKIISGNNEYLFYSVCY